MIRASALKKLDLINAAANVDDLRSLLGNRFEKLTGNLVGFHSIRIYQQWRVILKWVDGAAEEVQIVAETSLQAAGRDTATADRYQVIVSVNAVELAESGKAVSGTAPVPDEHENGTPARRATINGAGAIARETARRIACDCSVTSLMTANGEPTDIGRKSRLWPNAMARAIKDRDQHCQFYGCIQTQNLQIHHMIHWADGGSTSVSNGVCLCQGCHTKVHEGGYSIQPVDGNEQRLKEQFKQQQCTDDLTLFTVEKELRNNSASFNQVRKLLPTRYRFRIVDADGKDIRNSSSVNACSGRTHTSLTPTHSTRVEYVRPMSGGSGDGEDDAARQISEHSAVYRFDTGKYQVTAL